MWWINKFGELARYTLVLVHYIGTGRMWWINWIFIGNCTLYRYWEIVADEGEFTNLQQFIIGFEVLNCFFLKLPELHCDRNYVCHAKYKFLNSGKNQTRYNTKNPTILNTM